MAQSFEVTEKVVNGKTHQTAIVKSYNTSFVETATAVDASGADDTLVFLAGRATKDLRRVDEDYAAVVAAMNAASAGYDKSGVSLTVKAAPGDTVENTTPYAQMFAKSDVVEFFANPNDAADSFVITQTGANNQERSVWLVDDLYSAIKTDFNL